MSDTAVIRKIQKVIALARCGTNDAESANAWSKVFELLKKYNLTLDEVYGKSKKNNRILLPSGKTKKKWEVISWDSFFRIERYPMISLQIVPDKTIHSGKGVESLLNTFHSMYEGVMDRIWNEGFCIVFKTKNYASFQIVYESNRIAFYILIPSEFKSTVKHSIQNVWPKATVREVQSEHLSWLNPEHVSAATLELKDHYFKSILVERNRVEPLPSLMSAGQDVMEDDLAIVDIAFVPLSNRWQNKARDARNKYRKGIEPKKTPSKLTDILFLIGDFVTDILIEKVFGLIDMMFGTEQTTNEVDYTRANQRLRPATEQKFTHSGFNVMIRILAQSTNPARAEKTLTQLATAFKDVSADNEFEMQKVARDGRFFKPTTQFVKQIQNTQLPLLRINGNIISIPEGSQLLQMPSAPLQEEYPQIEQLSFREQRLPESLLDGNKEGAVPLGVTTGVDPEKVYIPGGMSSSEKDDRCTPAVAEGGQGSGKTVFATNQGVYWFGCDLSFEEWKKKGRTVFLYDVTGGKTIRDFLEVCPPDRYHRVRVVDYGMSDRRPSLGWQVPNLDSEDATSLAAQTIQFIELVTQNEMGPQTKRWVTVHAIAAFEANPDNTPLEAIQSLTNDAFRTEKIIPFIKSKSIKRELAIFAAMTPEQRTTIVAPIMNRYYKLTTSNPRIWECIAQRPLRSETGELINDYRKFMDGDDDGPYAVLINVPPADDKGKIIDEEVQQAIMLGEASKLWAATLTRNPMDPNLKEYLVLYDEPHQFMKGTPFFKRMFREIRKYRGRPLLLFHEWKAIKDPELAAAILGADPNIHLLKGADANFEKLASYLAPYTLEEYMEMPKYYAINRVKAGASSHVFMCKLMPPANEMLPTYPYKVIWGKSAEYMSRPVEEVRDDIFNREDDTFDADLLAGIESDTNESSDLECLRD